MQCEVFTFFTFIALAKTQRRNFMLSLRQLHRGRCAEGSRGGGFTILLFLADGADLADFWLARYFDGALRRGRAQMNRPMGDTQ